MKYYLRRLKEEICELCKEWEELTFSQGGMEFGKEDIAKAKTPGRTSLIHPNCRCTLSISPDGRPINDDTDYNVILKGAIADIYERENPTEAPGSVIEKMHLMVER